MTLDLDAYLAATRLSGLAITPQGRLLVHASAPDPAGTAFATAVWRVSREAADGPTSATPITLPRKGSGLAGVLPDGSLLLRAEREDPTAAEDAPDQDTAAWWLLPAEGGEARKVLTAPAGIGAVAVARDAGTVVVTTQVFPGVAGVEADREKAKQRKDIGTSALWFEGYPVRHWDHHLAPRAPRLFVADLAAGTLRDLTGDAGRALDEASTTVTPDGTGVVTTWQVELGRGRRRIDLVRIDTASGERHTLRTGEGDHGDPAVSPDGRWVAATWWPRITPERSAASELWLVPLDPAVGPSRRMATGLDRWPISPVFTADSNAVLFTADDEGRCSLFRVEVADPGAEAVRLSAAGAFTDVVIDPGGREVFALRSTVDSPPEVIALDPTAPGQEPRVLHAERPEQPWAGRLEEVSATAADGTALRAWLVLPAVADADVAAVPPHPLAVFIHGGPLGSWNAWSWRWQPMLFAARGYAVLLPDPALSTGYGQTMIDRGWQEWGGAPYTDVLALTDAALARGGLDPARTAVLGGSYGGYLTNWVIGHTDRFRCAVTHASLWELTGFQGTTDDATAWSDWFGDPVDRADFYRQWSPSSSLDAISTPTLVIHGEQDHRVPVGEGLRLWSDLQRRGVESAFLSFPDENHWVLQPGNIRVWYDAVLGWLDQHVRGVGAARPELT